MSAKKDSELQFKAVSKGKKTLRVGCEDYQLVFGTELKLNGVECHGVCDSGAKTIYLDVNSDQRQATLVHELVHAAAAEFGLRHHEDWCPKLEELIAEMVAKVVVANYRLVARKP